MWLCERQVHKAWLSWQCLVRELVWQCPWVNCTTEDSWDSNTKHQTNVSINKGGQKGGQKHFQLQVLSIKALLELLKNGKSICTAMMCDGWLQGRSSSPADSKRTWKRKGCWFAQWSKSTCATSNCRYSGTAGRIWYENSCSYDVCMLIEAQVGRSARTNMQLRVSASSLKITRIRVWEQPVCMPWPNLHWTVWASKSI